MWLGVLFVFVGTGNQMSGSSHERGHPHCGLSASNSGLYALTHMLHSMALQGQAPTWFAYVNRHGSRCVPVSLPAHLRAPGQTALSGALLPLGRSWPFTLCALVNLG